MKKMMMLFLAVSLFTIPNLQAAHVETPLPANTFITMNGLDWAWAYPVTATDGGFDLSYQSQFGWRLPTTLELESAPLATDFIFPGANVPLGGTDPVSGAEFQAVNAALDGAAACAAPYFSISGFDYCDWSDGKGQPYEPWAGLPGDEWWSDQLVVRGEMVEEYKPVPTMGQFALILLILLTGTLGVFGLRRMHKQ